MSAVPSNKTEATWSDGHLRIVPSGLTLEISVKMSASDAHMIISTLALVRQEGRQEGASYSFDLAKRAYGKVYA